MLINPDSKLFIYSITRDFGFAPNPFHGVCTLATCKPQIRKDAQVNDWVMGIGGTTLGEHNKRCIFLMKVTEKLCFQDYWNDDRFKLKKPVRNGSNALLLGDNIYHKDDSDSWLQENSHHSNEDGSINEANLRRDTTGSKEVLISNKFLYFGSSSSPIDLDRVNVKGGLRSYKKNMLTKDSESEKIILEMFKNNRSSINTIISDPVMFDDASCRVDQASNKII